MCAKLFEQLGPPLITQQIIKIAEQLFCDQLNQGGVEIVPYPLHRFSIGVGCYLSKEHPHQILFLIDLIAALHASGLADNFFAREKLQVSFFGGGLCPEALGLVAYLKNKAPNLAAVDISIFDQEEKWNPIQQGLLRKMLPVYASSDTEYSIQGHKCNVTRCDAARCCSANAISGSDMIIAQNFLSEVQKDREQAIAAFEGIVRRSNCRYLVFVENNYGENKELLNMINRRLWSKGLSTGLASIEYREIQPNFELPRFLQENLFTGESGLMVKKNVKFHFMVIEIART